MCFRLKKSFNPKVNQLWCHLGTDYLYLLEGVCLIRVTPLL